MSYRFLVPREVSDPHTAIVMGASVGDFYGYPHPGDHLGPLVGGTDATRKAQAIADRFGWPVLGYDAPGRGVEPYSDKLASRLRTNFEEVMEEGGTVINKVLAEAGIKNVVLAEHSLGNLSGLAFVHTGALKNVRRIVSTEPILGKHSLVGGLATLGTYPFLVERHHPKPPKPAGEEKNVLPISTERTIKDMRLYGKATCAAKAWSLLKLIGTAQPDIPISLTLAAHGLNGSPEQALDYALEFNELCPGSRAVILPRATHSWFDSSRVMGDVIAGIADSETLLPTLRPGFIKTPSSNVSMVAAE